MPPEAAVEEPPQAFGTSMEAIFDKAMPKSVEDKADYVPPDKTDEKPPESKFKSSVESTVEETGKEKKERKKPEKAEKPEKEEKVAKEEKKPEPKKSSLISDLLDSETAPAETAEPIEDEPKKAEVPAEFKGKTRESFEALATKQWEDAKARRAAEKKAAELEAKLTAGDPASKAALAEKDKLIKDYEARLQISGLEHSQWYEQNIARPLQDAWGIAQQAFADAGGDPKALASAFRLEGKQRAERIDELMGEISSEFAKGRIGRAIDDVDRINAQRQYALKNRDTISKQLKAQEDEQTAKLLQDHEEQVKQDLKDAKKYLLENHGIFIFKEIDNPKWKEEIQKMGDEAEQVMLRTSDRKQLSVITQMGVAFPRLWTFFKEERAARLKAEAENDSYRNSEPGVGSSRRKPAKQVEEEGDEEKPLKSAILDSIKSFGGIGA